MKKLIFLYDSMMTKEVQKTLGLNIKFVSLGYIHAKMYFFNDGKRRRYFCVNGNGRCVYGLIGIIDDYEEYKNAIFSFYYSTASYINKELPSDVYIQTKVKATPMRFNSINELEKCKTIKELNPIECIAFFGNPANERVIHSIDKSKYYRRNNGIDVVSYLKLLNERNKEKEEDE